MRCDSLFCFAVYFGLKDPARLNAEGDFLKVCMRPEFDQVQICMPFGNPVKFSIYFKLVDFIRYSMQYDFVMPVAGIKISADGLKDFEYPTAVRHYKLLNTKLTVTVAVIVTGIFVNVTGLYSTCEVDVQGDFGNRDLTYKLHFGIIGNYRSFTHEQRHAFQRCIDLVFFSAISKFIIPEVVPAPFG